MRELARGGDSSVHAQHGVASCPRRAAQTGTIPRAVARNSRGRARGPEGVLHNGGRRVLFGRRSHTARIQRLKEPVARVRSVARARRVNAQIPRNDGKPPSERRNRPLWGSLNVQNRLSTPKLALLQQAHSATENGCPGFGDGTPASSRRFEPARESGRSGGSRL